MSTETNPAATPGTQAAAKQPQATARLYRRTTLLRLTGTFISVLDFFIVNVAIPSIQRDLHASSAEIEFVVAGFALAYGSGLCCPASHRSTRGPLEC